MNPELFRIRILGGAKATVRELGQNETIEKDSIVSCYGGGGPYRYVSELSIGQLVSEFPNRKFYVRAKKNN